MLDSIFVGMSGLDGFSQGLKIISNNVANLNTPGFKASTLGFTDIVFQQGSGNAGNSGVGLGTLPPMINFAAGQTQTTNNPLDAAISGNGFFVMRKDGTVHYTRTGEFQFDKDGFLVSRVTGYRVAGFDRSGKLADITLDGLRTSPPQATSLVKFFGNLSSTATTDFTISGINLINSLGGQQTINLVFKNNNSTTPGSWTVTATDANNSTIGASANITFTNGQIDAAANSTTLTFPAANGAAAYTVKLDFSANVTSYAAGDTSTLAVNSQDGYTLGTMSSATFDDSGFLSVTYSNGQTVQGPQLALAQFATTDPLQEVGSSEFSTNSAYVAELTRPNAGSVKAGNVEQSNVDISQEFSDLVIVQRGYQASSRIISTADQMLQELFGLKSQH